MNGSWQCFDQQIKYSDPVQISTREELPYLIDKLGLKRIGIEIGVLEGDFSEILLQSGLGELCLIDLWSHISDNYVDSNNKEQIVHEERYQRVLKRFATRRERVSIIRGNCDDEVRRVANNSIDFIYIDANHEYSAVKRNLNDWYPKLIHGGLLAGHDYMDGIMNDGTKMGVKSAVNEFVKEHNLKLYVTKDDTPFLGNTGKRIAHNQRYFSWYFVKP